MTIRGTVSKMSNNRVEVRVPGTTFIVSERDFTALLSVTLSFEGATGTIPILLTNEELGTLRAIKRNNLSTMYINKKRLFLLSIGVSEAVCCNSVNDFHRQLQSVKDGTNGNMHYPSFVKDGLIFSTNEPTRTIWSLTPKGESVLQALNSNF